MLNPPANSTPVCDPNNGEGTELTSTPAWSFPGLSWRPTLDANTQSFLVSFAVHLLIIMSFSIIPIVIAPDSIAVLLQGSPPDPIEPDLSLEDIAYSETPSEHPGANSFHGEGMALATAPDTDIYSEALSLPPTEEMPEPNLDVTLDIKQAIGIVASPEVVRGMTGVGTQGTDGAIDRITYEILHHMEERPTLVCWLFDASGSLMRRRQEIRDRFERIYKELGIVREMREKKKQTKQEREAEPLLTSIVSFGQDVKLLTKTPTAELEEITAAIDHIDNDLSGFEYAFSALYTAADKYKHYRLAKGDKEPARNVIFVIVTDERGNDASEGLEKTLSLCKKYAMPVYVMGVPSPFGREKGYIKYVDPDPKFDQTPQWSEVDLGPESYYPERIQLGYEDNYYDEPVVDSGFGPFALSRLCYETGGIYFTIHPNRKLNQRVGKQEIDPFASHLSYFFDPDIMERYRPDYLPESEYVKKLQESPMRQALVKASQMSRVGKLDRPRFSFLKQDEAAFVNALTDAQKEPARLEYKLNALCEVLFEGSKHRDQELSPRWLASFDFSFGLALAEKVRNEGYNQSLAAAKRGLQFKEPKNNTWNIRPSSKSFATSKLEKEAAAATEMLERVVQEHPGTPWAYLASQELGRPIGWNWEESFTDTQPPPPRPAGNNGTPPPPQNDRARMIEKPPTRPVPKL